MNNTTVAIKAFMRPEKCKNCITYLHDAGFNNILVGIDGNSKQVKLHESMIDNLPFKVKLYRYKFNAGISYVRNRLLKKTKTKYFFLTDDDYYIPKESIECVNYLESKKDYFAIGLSVIEMARNQLNKSWTFDPYITKERELVSKVSDVKVEKFKEKYYFGTNVGCIENCAVFNTKKLKKIKWDERFIIGGEHIDFYLTRKYKFPDFKLAFAINIMAKHFSGGSKEFMEARMGGVRKKSRGRVQKKWNTINETGWGDNIFRYRPDLLKGKKIYTVNMI